MSSKGSFLAPLSNLPMMSSVQLLDAIGVPTDDLVLYRSIVEALQYVTLTRLYKFYC